MGRENFLFAAKGSYTSQNFHDDVHPLKPHQRSEIPWRSRLYTVIFEADTPAGKHFDVWLLVAIALSVIVVSFDSIRSVRMEWGEELYVLEWIFTLVFTVEYILRILSVRRPPRYIFSFFGIVDFLGIIPTYLSLLVPGTQILLVIRVLRVLRVFRILRLGQFLGEAELLRSALRASRIKIFVFLYTVVTLVIILGAMMYLIEGENSGFTSIPRSIYWAIVTLTTVGYGDISPQTSLGQLLAAFIMILGYGILAVPTGIVTVEMSNQRREVQRERTCDRCGLDRHESDARYCKRCGKVLQTD